MTPITVEMSVKPDVTGFLDDALRVLSLPDEIRWETTIAEEEEEKASSIHVGAGTSRENVITMREARDAQFGMPKLFIPPLQVNMRAGALPEANENGRDFLRVPVNVL